jgi:CheY-like chemotaxis protein
LAPSEADDAEEADQPAPATRTAAVEAPTPRSVARPVGHRTQESAPAQPVRPIIDLSRIHAEPRPTPTVAVPAPPQPTNVQPIVRAAAPTPKAPMPPPPPAIQIAPQSRARIEDDEEEDEGEEEEIEDEEAGEEEEGFAPRILVVQANSVLRLATKSTLDAAGFDTIDAANLDAACEALAEEGFDAVLVDVGKFDGGDLKTLERIKQALETAPPPPGRDEEEVAFVVALAANPSKNECERLENAGADLVLSKSLDTTALVSKIAEALGLEEIEEEEADEEESEAA